MIAECLLKPSAAHDKKRRYPYTGHTFRHCVANIDSSKQFVFSFLFFLADWFVLLVVTCCLWERKHRASCAFVAACMTTNRFSVPGATYSAPRPHCQRNCNAPFLCLVCVHMLCDCAVTKHRPDHSPVCGSDLHQKLLIVHAGKITPPLETLSLFFFFPVDYF